MASTKILVIEDEILIAREIEDYLSALGYEVVGIAADAETALQQIAATQPDLVLVDIVIQGEQDGIDVAMQVRDRFHIPVIYLTAYADEQTLARAKQTHPFGYILKPFDKRDLRTTIEIALSRHQAELDNINALAASYRPDGMGQLDAIGEEAASLEYLSILSHELRNPLAAIKLSTIMLGDYGHRMDESKKQQLLQRIQFAADSMNQLLEDVLTLGQTEHRLTSFTPENLDVVEFCQSLVETMQWSASNQYTIRYIRPSEPVQACLDKKLLWHLLNNLLGNAVKYSPAGGTVVLKLDRQQQEVWFEISDQGIGIAPDDMANLFQPFHRGNNVGTLPGTGLGLAIVKRITELHKGEVCVNSEVGKGTTFVVKLPSQGGEDKG